MSSFSITFLLCLICEIWIISCHLYKRCLYCLRIRHAPVWSVCHTFKSGMEGFRSLNSSLRIHKSLFSSVRTKPRNANMVQVGILATILGTSGGLSLWRNQMVVLRVFLKEALLPNFAIILGWKHDLSILVTKGLQHRQSP